MKTFDPRHVRQTAIALPWRAPAPALPRRDPFAAIRRELARAAAACGAFEWVALGYLSFSAALIAVFGEHLPGAATHFPAVTRLLWMGLQFGVAALIITLCWADSFLAARGSPHATLCFARHWYPQAFFLFCFEELHYIVHLIFPGWFDSWLIGFDRWLTGVHPTLWLEQFAHPALNDFMQMAYISYFFYLTILGAILYGRGERRAFWAAMTSSVVSYVIGYVIALALPVQSPYHALAALQRVELRGGPFTALINLIERFGRVHGAAFPSAHVSGSFVAVLSAWRYRRCLFWIYLPFFLCMMVSTVYGRYHYVADVLGGLLVGAIGFCLGHALMRFHGAVPDGCALTQRDSLGANGAPSE